MKWLRRLALAALLLVVLVAIAWRLFSERLEERLRASMEEQLASALATAAEVGGLTVALAPPEIGALAIALGPNGEWLRAKEMKVRLFPYASLVQRRPVFAVDADGVWVDVGRLTAGVPTRAQERPESRPPAFRVARLHFTDARVRIPAEEHPLDVSAEVMTGEVEAGRDGRVTMTAGAERAYLERRGARVAVDRLKLEGGQTGRGLVVRALEARGEQIEIVAALEEEEPLRHRLLADVDLARFAGLDERLGGLGGRLRVLAVFTGALEDPGVEGSVAVERLRIRDEELGDLRARLVRREDRITIERATLAGFGGEARVAGSIAIGGKQDFALRAGWRDLDVAMIAAAAGAADVPTLRAAGLVDLSGNLAPFSIRGRGKGRLRRDDKTAPLVWEIDAEAEGETNRIRLTGTQATGNRVQVNVTLGPGEAVGGTAEASIEDTAAVWALAGIEDPAHATGSFSVTTKISGTRADPRFEGRIGGRGVKVQGGDVERIEGTFAADLRQVRADAIRLAFAGGTIDVTGTFGIAPEVQNAWEVRVEAIEPTALAALAGRFAATPVPLSGGTLSASFTGQGPWSTATLQGSVQARRFSLAGEPFEALDATIGAHLPGWTVDARVVHREAESLGVHAEGQGGERLAARIESTPWSLGSLASAAESKLTGTVRIEGAVQGPVKALDGAFDVDAAGVAFEDRRLGDVSATVAVAAGAWQANARLLDGAMQVGGKLLGEGGFSLAAEWTDAHFGPLLRADGTLRADSSGTLRVAGRSAEPRAVDGELVVPKLELASGSYAVAALEPVRVRGRSGTFAIESLLLAGKNAELEASGIFTTGGKVDVDVKGRGSLRLLESLGEPIASSRGRFDLVMSVERPLEGTPQLNGRLSLSDAALDLGLPVAPTQTNGEIRFAGSRIEIQQLDGEIGGGKFSVGGAVDLAAGPDLTWQVREASTGMVPSVEHELSGEGSVRGSWQELTVAGRVDVLRALYGKRIEISSFLPSFRRELAKAPDTEPAERPMVVRLDLRVVASDELFIDNNFARVEAAADLQVNGEATDPRLAGQVQALSGEVYFRDRTFQLTTAVVDFRPELGFEAALNIVAETEIDTGEGTYTVTLQVTGTTDKPRVTMAADDPSLTQNDVASLIAFGKTVAQLQQEGGGVAMTDVLLLAPGGYPEKVEKRAAILLRLDRVDIEPTFSRTTGEFEPQLILGKKFGENFSTTLAATFGATASQILRATYQLTPRFSLLATLEPESQNRDEAIGGGARYRREFRDTLGFSLLELGDRRGTETPPP